MPQPSVSVQRNPHPRDLRYLQFVTDRMEHLPDAKIAARFNFESPEALYRQLSQDGYPVCPECGAAPISGKHCESAYGGRSPGAGTEGRRELPPPAGAYRLFRERLEMLLKDAEGLGSRHQTYQDKRFPGVDVYPGTLAWFRYLPDGDGGSVEVYSEREWQKLCEQYDQDPEVEQFMIPDSVVQVPRELSAAPPEPVTTLIGVYALAGGDMDALIELLCPGEPSGKILEEVRRCIDGEKKRDNKYGLKALARQLAILVYGGSIIGAPPPPLSSVEHDAACYITWLREKGHSEGEVEQHLSNHRKPDGSKLTKADIRRLGSLRLKYPRELCTKSPVEYEKLPPRE